MVTLIKDIKAEEKTAAKEATIRKNSVAREKIISMFSLQQKSESEFQTEEIGGRLEINSKPQMIIK